MTSVPGAVGRVKSVEVESGIYAPVVVVSSSTYGTPATVYAVTGSGAYERYSTRPTITAGAYSAGDVVGGLLTFTLTGAATSGGGIMTRIAIFDADAESAAGTLYLFHTAPATILDNAAFSLSDSDFDKLLFTQTISGYTSFTAFSVFLQTNINIGYKGTSLYAYFVCSGTPTYTATNDLKFEVSFIH